tara:strand:- start:201 stop:368 length:168 start_codon:yes stop_codon:yes gene_type:complete
MGQLFRQEISVLGNSLGRMALFTATATIRAANIEKRSSPAEALGLRIGLKSHASH